ncbi:MAG: hypothetical protein Q8O32_03415 [bacterium]|nr:hypothetical protein [bacterium]
MKYLSIIFIFLISAFLSAILNFYGNGWQYLQPFLIAVLLIYFNVDKIWLYYSFAFISGLFIDSFSGVFGLQTFIFLFIIWLLKNLQLTIFTSKNIVTIIVLSLFAFLFFWASFYLANFLADWELYVFNIKIIWQILKMMGLNMLIFISAHLLYYNLWLKKHERQSF